jgi:hypothetical protein
MSPGQRMMVGSQSYMRFSPKTTQTESSIFSEPPKATGTSASNTITRMRRGSKIDAGLGAVFQTGQLKFEKEVQTMVSEFEKQNKQDAIKFYLDFQSFLLMHQFGIRVYMIASILNLMQHHVSAVSTEGSMTNDLAMENGLILDRENLRYHCYDC